jgi:16S rRNA (cytosine1402-N4)-methyltransferase
MSRRHVLSLPGLMRSPSTGGVEGPFSAHFHLVRTGRHPGGLLVEGLRMSWSNGPEEQQYTHLPVMVEEVIELLAPVPPGVVLDATVGGGGHAAAILERLPDVQVVGLDQDPAAVTAATAALARFGPRARVVRARFDRLDGALDGAGVAQISGALFDLGVSSPQFDRPERGFSYRTEAPLDMRMDPGQSLTAADLVNGSSERDLIALLVENGEGRFAGRIVRAIVAARPVETTAQLADIVRTAIPAATRRHGGHPARRTFQAIRIAVNAELTVLPVALDGALARLAPGGRCVVLSYHSGEDRIVKEHFRTAATGGCICPPGLPCVCGATPTVRLLNRGARKPSAAEVAANPRSESARLRAVERLPLAEVHR